MALSLTREQKKLRAQIAANSRWSKEDPKEGTKLARAAFERRFELEVDPDGTLPEVERQRRAAAALKAHMQRLALASSRARRKAGASSSASRTRTICARTSSSPCWSSRTASAWPRARSADT